MAGSTANLAFLGYCALLAGVFNLIFFPLYYRNPQKVGVPFLLAGAAQFLLIALLTAFRFTVPLFRDVLNLPDPANMGAEGLRVCGLRSVLCGRDGAFRAYFAKTFPARRPLSGKILFRRQKINQTVYKSAVVWYNKANKGNRRVFGEEVYYALYVLQLRGEQGD